MPSRKFYGKSDVQQIALYSVFPNTPLTVVSPIELAKKLPLVIEGPADHLNFFYPFFLKLIKLSPIDHEGRWGTWGGVTPPHENHIDLFYHYGWSFVDRFELLEHKFRRDIVFLCDIKLCEETILEVVCFSLVRTRVTLALPEELPHNGSIVYPTRPSTIFV